MEGRVKGKSICGRVVVLGVVLVWLFLATICEARIIIVNDDGPADFDNIQAAIDDANDGDFVVVLPGTYTGAGNRDIDFGGRVITVCSADPEDPCVVSATVIDCQNANGHRGFYFHSGEGPNSVVSGFTITGGYVSGGLGPVFSGGGGIYVEGASPTIENCHIIGNEVMGVFDLGYAAGGGIFCGSNSNPVVRNCFIADNVVESYTTPVAEGADARGGGLYCDASSSATCVNCVIHSNYVRGGDGIDNMGYATEGGDGTGGGVYGADGSQIVLKNCLLYNNSVQGGWGGYTWPSAGPDGDARGGAIYGANSITNTTIMGNSVSAGGSEQGHGVFSSNSSLITDSILWANSGDDVYGTGVTVTYSCTEEIIAGSGNIHSDPCFVSGPLGDYYLSQVAAGQEIQSPCVDAGSDLAAN
ncbi:MAG: right-handed parallel beta-helix repeat-containing protein, partial [Planctomycetota bacterium]